MKSPANFSLSKGFFLRKFLHRHWALAFTLVELLVVIAIVGLLAALAITGLAKARESGRVAKSSSQMRQMAAAALLWSNDNGGLMPTAQGPMIWRVEIYPYIYNTNAPSPFFNTSEKAENLRGTVYHCPLKDQAGEGTPVRSYGWNAYLRDMTILGTIKPPLAMVRVKQPSKTMMLATTLIGAGVGAHNIERLSTRAGGRVLVVFVDGHLERLALEDIPRDQNNLFWRPEGPP